MRRKDGSVTTDSPGAENDIGRKPRKRCCGAYAVLFLISALTGVRLGARRY
ncbi:hypothetical protein HC231_12150 [Brenneria izadpanahii]|uniref:Uncharacterized protein n=1 Tax=Brenneria izadpanahii TaxID=2722756 RepID=A0ABX7UTF9_9GAMM|nr:hypothetical protein [Brenneria izadpanahii]QTF08575.1 hypothetical protein HC231_12150 [Brenneria izadpanahii]